VGDAFVGAAGGGVAGLEELRPHVLTGQVVAHREDGLQQHPGPGRLGDDGAADADAHSSGAPQDVDAGVRVAGVDEDLIVLLEHAVHRVPVEGDESGDLGRRLRRPLEGAGRVYRSPVPDPDRPVGPFPRRGVGPAPVARLEQLHAHVVPREQVRRCPAGGWSRRTSVLSATVVPPRTTRTRRSVGST
jgi:hypothetical protein